MHSQDPLRVITQQDFPSPPSLSPSFLLSLCLNPFISRLGVDSLPLPLLPSFSPFFSFLFFKYELDVGWVIRGSGYADELPGCHHVPGGPRASHEPRTCPCYEGRTANLNRHMPICIYPFYDGRTHSKWPLLRRTRGEAGLARLRPDGPPGHAAPNDFRR